MDTKQPLTNSIKFIDLFAGVGGFRYGLERLNVPSKQDGQGITQEEHEEWHRLHALPHEGSLHKEGRSDELPDRSDNEGQFDNQGTINQSEGVTEEQSLSSARQGSVSNIKQSGRGEKSTFTCVYSNEWDKYANSVYKKHYQECDDQDITTIDASDIPEHDLLCAGFPCQSFSIAGKRGGFDDTRGTLFFEIARIAKQKQSPYLLLENVKGLLSHDKGRTFGKILETLDELGYDVQWQLLNSKNFGVPQNRERVYIIANLRTKPRPEVFPILGQSEGSLKYIGGILSDRDKWLKDEKDYSRNFSQGQRVYSTKGIGSTLAGNAGGLGGKTGLYAVDKPYIQNPKMRNYKKNYKNSATITATSHKEPPVVNSIRRLTPLECERLQGFPDRWTQFGVDSTGDLIEISDTQRYKMMGNAVTTNVITAIGSRLASIL